MKPYKLEETRKNDDVTIKQAVDKMLEVYRLKQKFSETSVYSAWPDIIGKAIANRTTKLYIRDKKLFIQVESAVIKHELTLMRQQIVARINEFVGSEMVESVVIL